MHWQSPSLVCSRLAARRPPHACQAYVAAASSWSCMHAAASCVVTLATTIARPGRRRSYLLRARACGAAARRATTAWRARAPACRPPCRPSALAPCRGTRWRSYPCTTSAGPAPWRCPFRSRATAGSPASRRRCMQHECGCGGHQWHTLAAGPGCGRTRARSSQRTRQRWKRCWNDSKVP